MMSNLLVDKTMLNFEVKTLKSIAQLKVTIKYCNEINNRLVVVMQRIY